MADSPNSKRSPARVTLRTLAQTAGVSAQAVSLALRNHPSIAGATRRRIQQLAQRAGYRPDPQVVKLMHHLRAGRGQGAGANVCALTTRPANAPETFCDLLLEGAMNAARAAGFALDVLHFENDAPSGRRLQQVLRARGVEGIILLPMARVCKLDDLLDWREYAVISATLSVTGPRFDSVAASHFQNVFRVCEQLRSAGYRRPGLIIHRNHDRRCGHSITAAQVWPGIYGGLELIRAHVCDRLERAALRRWLETEKPDAVLVEQDGMARDLHDLGAELGARPIVSCSARPLADGSFPFPGNYDQPRLIGGAAVEILTRMVMVGKRGIPEHPQTTLIEGIWVGGAIAPLAARE